jgi:hypothetical protein
VDLDEERRVALTSADAFRQEMLTEMETSDGENLVERGAGKRKVEAEVSNLWP